DRRGSRYSRPLTRVPVGLPAPGWTTSPAGLSSTNTSLSSYRTWRAMSSGSARVCSSSTACSETSSPPRTRSRGRAASPSSRTSPDLIQADRREREYSGNSSASTASKRRPAALSGILASRGAAASVRTSVMRLGSLLAALLLRRCYYPTFVPPAPRSDPDDPTFPASPPRPAAAGRARHLRLRPVQGHVQGHGRQRGRARGAAVREGPRPDGQGQLVAGDRDLQAPGRPVSLR